MEEEQLCQPGCTCEAKNKYFSMCNPPKGEKQCSQKSFSEALKDAKKHAQDLQDKLSHATYVFETTEKKLWKAKGSADWYKKKADGAAAYAGKLWWQLNETKKEVKCAKYGNCEAVPKILKQANKAQKNYDHLAGIMKEKNSVRDALLKENSEAKRTKELLTPQVKAAWTAHARWDAALHPSTTTTKHPKHKGHGHKSEGHGHKHHRGDKSNHESEDEQHEHSKGDDDSDSDNLEDDDGEIDDSDLEEISA